jgi:nanoRNase/pAp phosphatase (c-di-AMP/oligoRNAs hydrolase)
MRMVEGVEVAIAIKTYPDGKVTGKIRSSIPIAEDVAKYFGGGGHPYAAGFRTYDTTYEETVQDLIGCCNDLIEQYEKDNPTAESTFIGSF